MAMATRTRANFAFSLSEIRNTFTRGGLKSNFIPTCADLWLSKYIIFKFESDKHLRGLAWDFLVLFSACVDGNVLLKTRLFGDGMLQVLR